MDAYDSTLSVGIDLGTTYSCVGIWRNNKVEIVDENGKNIMPSMVGFDGNERLIGQAAYDKATRNPKNTVYDAKRLIGHKYTDEEIQGDLSLFPFKVVKDNDNRPQIEV